MAVGELRERVGGRRRDQIEVGPLDEREVTDRGARGQPLARV
jgi:hypothetical protein